MSKPKEKENIDKKISEKEKEKKISLLKRGDYTVHILIEEVKDLITIKENVLPEPRVKVICFEKSEKTDKLETGCQDHTYNRHMYFEKTNLSLDYLNSAKIQMEVYDYLNAKKNQFFGCLEFDIEYIYSQPNHCIKNIWYALTNNESDDITKVRGFIKLSMSVLNIKDRIIELKPGDNPNASTVVPPQVKNEYEQLRIYLLRAEKLPNIDKGGDKTYTYTTSEGCQPYFILEYDCNKTYTKVVNQINGVAHINQYIDVPIRLPTVHKELLFRVFDEGGGIFEKDKQIGSFSLNIDDIRKGLYDETSIINIYGGYVAKSKNDEVGKNINVNAIRGSAWVGRLFFKIKHTKVDKPNKGSGYISDKEQDHIQNNIQLTYNWIIKIKLFDLYFPPDKNEKYGIIIRCQEQYIQYHSKKSDNIYKTKTKFNQCQTLYVKTVNKTLEELPHIFIYLMDEDMKNAIAYQRLLPSEFLNDDVCIIKLLPEPTTKKCKLFCESGIVKIRLHIYSQDEENLIDNSMYQDGEESKNKNANIETYFNPLHPDWGGELDSNVNNKICNVSAIVYMSRQLVSGDLSGTSDPYVTIEGAGERQETHVKSKAVNGIWMEKLDLGQFYMDSEDQSTWPIFKIQVKDKDNKIKEIFNDIDILGYAYICLSDTNYGINTTKLIKPKWHQLYLEQSNKPQGQLLLSFYIFEENYIINEPINYMPELVPYTLEINALGLRDLKPLSLFPVKKPIISFELNSLNISPDARDTLKAIKTQPKSTGPNPNITNVIKSNIKLSKDSNFIPDLQCEVFDHILGKMIKNSLGIFMLNTSIICKQTKMRFEFNKIKANKIIALDEEDEKEEIKENQNNNITIENTNNLQNENLLKVSQNKGSAGELNTSINDIELENKKSDSINQPFVEKNESNENTNKNKKIKEKRIFSRTKLICYKPEELPKIYTGLIDNDIINNKKDRQNFCVLKPTFIEYKIPGTAKDAEKYYKEDSDNIPNEEYYCSIGSNKGKNRVQLKSEKMADLMLIETQEKNEIETQKKQTKEMNIINQQNQNSQISKELKQCKTEKMKRRKEKLYSQFTTTKHYRRVYGCNLEDVKELSLGKPFYESMLIRGKYEDLSTATSVIETMSSETFKVMKRFPCASSVATNKNILRAKRGKKRKMYDIEDIEKDILTNEQKKLNEQIQDELLEYQANVATAFDTRPYGKFKALIRISQNDDLKEYENFIEEVKKKYNNKLPKYLRFLNEFEEVSKQILIERDVIVRVYILTLNNLADRDVGGNPSDPYIVLKMGDKEVVNEKKNYKDDLKDCDWYKHYDIYTRLPGSGLLTVRVMDYDPIFSDDMVGETKIDIEDRYFDQKWLALKNKPIETRTLSHPDYGGNQGTVKLWVEIFDKDKRSKHIPWNIEPQPQIELELRLIIWETENMRNLDVEDTSDIYINAFLDDKDIHSTDIHFRCQNGNASFNWRMLIPVKYPMHHYNLTLLAYDNDILAKDDFICGASINVKRLIEDSAIFDTPISFSKMYFDDIYDPKKPEYINLRHDSDKLITFEEDSEDQEHTKFWVQLKEEDNNGQKRNGGRVLCSLEVMPKWKAELLKVGKGREEPNVNPYLPPPTGRIQFHWNPITMFNQFVGPKFRKKCYIICCITLCIIYLIIVIPYVIYHLGGEVVNPFNYIKSKK